MAVEIDRDTELSTRAGIRDQVKKLGKRVEKAFEKQQDRSEDLRDYWEAYNCTLSDRQYYNGTSQIFVPFVHDAIEARKTRYCNQLFPSNQRYVEVTTANGDIPAAEMALLEHYVKAERLRSKVVRPLLVNGDVEGQYSIYVSWRDRKRHVTSRVLKPVELDGEEVPAEAAEPYEDMHDEDISDSGPNVEVLADNDLVVWPPTCDTIEEAIECGGFVAVARRWSKEKIDSLVAHKEITKQTGEDLKKMLGSGMDDDRRNTPKQLATNAGVRSEGPDKIALVYEIWSNIKVEGERRLCRSYFGGERFILGAKLCPYWCDRVPIISAPVEKVANVFKGVAPMAAVYDLQILANDVVNEAADTGHFSAMPIIMTDPEKNPKADTLVLAPAAIWKTSPQTTSFGQFPDMWSSMMDRLLQIREQIFQTLSVNPSMIPGSVGKPRKLNQAEIANEQQVDMLQTADAVSIIEENILSPLLQRMVEYDHQFRDDTLTIRAFGEIGRQAVMQEIEPLQIDHRYEYRWFGVEASRNAAQNQQQVAALNVLQNIPSPLYPGYKLNLAPAIVQMVENMFGPRIGPLVFEELTMISVDPHQEDEMMEHGFPVEVHPADNDVMHIQEHMQALQMTGDPHGTIRQHITKHQVQLQQKAMAQHQQGAAPGGGGGGGGVTPPGAIPSGPQQQNPPGSIPHDNMARHGAVVMPRPR